MEQEFTVAFTPDSFHRYLKVEREKVILEREKLRILEREKSPRKRCHKCGQVGHIQRNCPKKMYRCRNCGSRDHLWRKCSEYTISCMVCILETILGMTLLVIIHSSRAQSRWHTHVIVTFFRPGLTRLTEGEGLRRRKKE